MSRATSPDSLSLPPYGVMGRTPVAHWPCCPGIYCGKLHVRERFYLSLEIYFTAFVCVEDERTTERFHFPAAFAVLFATCLCSLTRTTAQQHIELSTPP